MEIIIEESTKHDIKEWSHELLVSSRCIDIFPTPADKLAAFIDLKVSPEDLSKVTPIYVDKHASILQKILGQLRGLLVRDAKLIYLDRSCNKERQRFTLLHEVGHNLPWQVAISSMYADDDFTLSPETKEQFEAEASYFASETLFQSDKFAEMVQNEPLSIQTAIQTSPFFGASIHATLRRYVEFSPMRCALLVMKDPLPTKVSLRDLFLSQPFLSDIGRLRFPESLDRLRYPFVELYIKGEKSGYGTFIASVKENPIALKYEYFNNSYNGFVLFYP